MTVSPALAGWAVFAAGAVLAAGCGIVLYNAALSSFAVALLILSLARPAPKTGLLQEQ